MNLHTLLTRTLLASLFIFSCTSQAANQSFSQSKKALAAIYKDQHQTSFYSGCDFNYQGKKLKPDLNNCGYKRQPYRMGTRHACMGLWPPTPVLVKRRPQSLQERPRI